MAELSEEELADHIEDSDFFQVYGNPVLVRSKKGREHDCVIMSLQYYERLKNIGIQLCERIGDV